MCCMGAGRPSGIAFSKTSGRPLDARPFPCQRIPGQRKRQGLALLRSTMPKNKNTVERVRYVMRKMAETYGPARSPDPPCLKWIRNLGEEYSRVPKKTLPLDLRGQYAKPCPPPVPKGPFFSRGRICQALIATMNGLPWLYNPIAG